MDEFGDREPGLGSRLFFFFLDSALVLGVGTYTFAPDVDSDRFNVKFTMFLFVLGLAFAATVGVIRAFSKNIRSAKQKLEKSKGNNG